MLKTLVYTFGINISEILKWYTYNIKNFQAVVSAQKLFMKTLTSGETALDVLHAELCGKPPIPIKAK
jgi:hypothetical protein